MAIRWEWHHPVRSFFKFFIVLLLLASAIYCVGFLSGTKLVINLTNQLHNPTRSEDFTNSKVKNEDGSSFTLACVFPHVNPYDPNIMKISGLDKKPINCTTYPPDLSYLDGNNLRVNLTLVKLKYGNDTFKHCKYQTLERISGHETSVKEGNWSTPFNESIKLSEDTEFIRVFCFNTDSKIISRTYLALIPKKEFLDELQTVRLKKRMVEYSPVESLNVVMVGIDSLSRHHLMRAMNKTYTYLMTNLTSFDLTMHTQLGINTFPNFLPLFTGQSEEEIDRWWNRGKYTDAFDLAWRLYETAGYRTFYTEDWPSIGGFHFIKKGFQHRTTMYNSRAIALAIENDKEVSSSSSQCIGYRAEVEFHLDYLTRFLDKFSHTPVFALTFLTKLCHEHLLTTKMGDEYFYNFLKNVHDKGLLNTTLLIFFSDHGPRWGEIRDTFNGMIESRTPFTILSFPEWFVQKYKNLARNLRVNTKRLTTHFDTHATLLDLLYFKTNSTPPYVRPSHGLSLFQQIPENRTCEDIPIPPQFCLCGQKEVKQEDTNTTLAQKFALIVVSTANLMRDQNLCQRLTLKNITSLIQILLPEAARNEKKEKSIYKIRLETSPGDAQYEATVFYNRTSSEAVLGRDIERLNLYRGQAECVDDANKRPFCYCKHLLDKKI